MNGQNMAPPLISIVICSRNDAYVDNMLERQQIALNLLAGQMREFPFSAEIILVEWNPPSGQPSLKEALKWPSFGNKVSVQIISVPGEFHRRFKDADVYSFNAAVAWNIGIRRARGKFILPKAADTIYSNDIIKWLAKGELDGHALYRCDRYDVSPSAIDIEHGNELLLEMADNIEEQHTRLPVYARYGIADLHTNGAGDFILMNRSYWHKIRGFEESETALAFDIDGLAMHGAHAAGAFEMILPDTLKVFKISHKSQFSKRTGRSCRSPWILIDLLMKVLCISEKWRISLRIFFDYPRRTVRGISGVTFPSYARHFIATARRWAKGDGPFYLNGPDWGYVNEVFDSHVICSAQWESNDEQSFEE